MAQLSTNIRARRVTPFLVVLSLLAAACTESGDYLAVAGGGFVFNYRIAEATYGIALKPMRELPAAGVVEATLENPAGGEPIVMRKEGPFNPTRISFETPPVEGVVKGKPYKVVVVLRDASGATLQIIEKTFTSELDQSVLPDRPLAIGPGYQKNIDGSTSAYPPSIGADPYAPAPE
jgi:hypothetical protein